MTRLSFHLRVAIADRDTPPVPSTTPSWQIQYVTPPFPTLPAPGGCSRAIAAVVSCPITVVKTRMEFGSVQGSSTLGALRAITRAEGVRGLFGGLGPTVLSNAPFAGLYYMFYTRLQVCV